MLQFRQIAAIFMVAVLWTLPLAAHHAFAAEFDSTRPVRLNGTVTKVEWLNPHAHFYMRVTHADGDTTNWEVELASPNVLIRRGWNRYSIKQGDQVSVRAFMARDGSRMAAARVVDLPNGQTMVLGTSGDGGPE